MIFTDHDYHHEFFFLSEIENIEMLLFIIANTEGVYFVDVAYLLNNWITILAEGPKEKAGGMAYEVVLKPATADNAPRPSSPPKERPLSQEIIDKKLKEAEERRLVRICLFPTFFTC